MRILLIHTAGGEGSVAIADTESVPAIVAAEVLPGRTSSERLVPAVRRLLEAHKWRLGELAAIGVVHGPGSFTGVRVGLSAAKGLSEAAGVPLIVVSRLALLAGCVDGGGQSVHAVLDAGRGEFYYGQYVGRQCVREMLLGREEVVGAAAHGPVIVCEAKVAEAVGELHPRVVDEPSAGDALPLVLVRIDAADFDDAAIVDANYLRRTDAELLAKQASRRVSS